MTLREIIQKLRYQPFEAFEVVTSSGNRYPVRHPEMARLTNTGALYIFQPDAGEPGVLSSPDVVSVLHITALEPLGGPQQNRRAS